MIVTRRWIVVAVGTIAAALIVANNPSKTAYIQTSHTGSAGTPALPQVLGDIFPRAAGTSITEPTVGMNFRLFRINSAPVLQHRAAVWSMFSRSFPLTEPASRVFSGTSEAKEPLLRSHAVPVTTIVITGAKALARVPLMPHIYALITQTSRGTALPPRIRLYESRRSDSFFVTTMTQFPGYVVRRVAVSLLNSTHLLVTLWTYNSGSDGSMGAAEQLVVDTSTFHVTFHEAMAFDTVLVRRLIHPSLSLLKQLHARNRAVIAEGEPTVILAGATHVVVFQWVRLAERLRVIPMQGVATAALVRLYGTPHAIVDVEPMDHFHEVRWSSDGVTLATTRPGMMSPIIVKPGTRLVFLGLRPIATSYTVFDNLESTVSVADPSEANALDDSITPSLPTGRWQFVLESFSGNVNNPILHTLSFTVHVES